MKEIIAPVPDVGYDYNAPLRWYVEGRFGYGVEVSEIPGNERIFFFDESGPVVRFDMVQEARWWVKLIEFKRIGKTLPVRITRVLGVHADHLGDGYFYIIPNPGQALVIHCTRDKAHDGCGEIECALLEENVKKWIVDPIVAMAKAN